MLLLPLALALASCNPPQAPNPTSGNTPPVNQTPSGAGTPSVAGSPQVSALQTLSGSVYQYKLESLQAAPSRVSQARKAYLLEVDPTNQERSAVSAQGQITANGDLSINLPSQPTYLVSGAEARRNANSDFRRGVSALMPQRFKKGMSTQCDGDVNYPADVQIGQVVLSGGNIDLFGSSVALSLMPSRDSMPKAFNISQGELSSYSIMYSSKPVALYGSLHCKNNYKAPNGQVYNTNTKVSYSISLKKGWNYLRSSSNMLENGDFRMQVGTESAPQSFSMLDPQSLVAPAKARQALLNKKQ